MRVARSEILASLRVLGGKGEAIGIFRLRSNRKAQEILRLAMLALVASFFAYDLFVDAFLQGEAATAHFIVESIVFIAVLAILLISFRDLSDLRSRLRREETRNKALAGNIAQGIDAQMREWKFTPSEREVAWMIIKGYRFSEIAETREVKESTSRLQATSVYAKAGVRGRAEFVAEIVDNLLAPIWKDEVVDERTFPSG